MKLLPEGRAGLSLSSLFFYLIIGSTLGFSSLTMAEERCSRGKCFEWPIISPDTTLDRMPTNGVWSKPDGDGPFPAVLIAESCGGATPAVDELWPSFFKRLGYVTYTPRILKRLGQNYCPSLRFVVESKNRVKMIKVIYSALDDLAKKPYVQKNNIGIIGFSLGGILIRDIGEIKNLKSSGGLKFKYSIPVYGSCTFLERRGDKIPMLIIQAEKENPKKRKLCLKVKSANFFNVKYHEISGAYHAFDDARFKKIKKDVAGNKMKYSESALAEAKQTIESFLSAID